MAAVGRAGRTAGDAPFAAGRRSRGSVGGCLAARSGSRAAPHALGGREGVVAGARRTRTTRRAGRGRPGTSRGVRAVGRRRPSTGCLGLGGRVRSSRRGGELGRIGRIGWLGRTRTRSRSRCRRRGRRVVGWLDHRGGCGLARRSRGRLDHRLGRRCPRCGLGGRLLRGPLAGRLELVSVLVGEPLHDGRLDRRRRRLDELAHLLELGQDDLALHSELFGELVDSDLSHASPSGPSLCPPPAEGAAGPLAGVHAHRKVLIECS